MNALTQSVAAEVGTVKRALQMNMFAGKKDHDEVAMKNNDAFRATAEGQKLYAPLPEGLGPNGKFTKTLGQVIGQIYSVQERKGQLRDGTPTNSLIAIGEFEAANYTTGEVMESYTAYLPRYFLETCKALKVGEEGGPNAIPLALEIVLTPTGKPIPTAYEIRNLARKRPESVMNQIKQELASMNRLRVSAPVAAPAAVDLQIEDASDLPPAEETVIDPPADDVADPEHAPEVEAELEEPAAEQAAEGDKPARGRQGR